jgi:hypothetical protein
MHRPQLYETRLVQKMDSAPVVALLAFCWLFERPNGRDCKSTQKQETAESENRHNATSPMPIE